MVDVRIQSRLVIQRHLCRCTTFVAILIGWSGLAVSQDGTAEVLKVLSENEVLYEDLEVSWICTFDLGIMKYPHPKTVKHREDKGRYVRQKGMYFLDFSRDQESIKPAADDLKHWGMKSGFDGGSTRCLENNGGLTGNVVAGLRDDRNKFLPHTICLSSQYRQQMVPLSVWLAGADAIAAVPTGKIDKANEHTVALSGKETIDGLACQKLTVAFSPRGEKPPRVVGKLVMWLAEERNYLPIRTKHYSLGVSAEIPIAETEMSDLRELKPGIWLPYNCQMTLFDKPSMEEDGKHVAAWTESHVVTNATLDPKYDKSFFQIAFPNGTPVYQIKDDKVVSSHVQGGIPLPTASTRSSWRWWPLFVIVNGLVVLFFAAMIVRSRRATVKLTVK